jgi:hypothetical protein
MNLFLMSKFDFEIKRIRYKEMVFWNALIGTKVRECLDVGFSKPSLGDSVWFMIPKLSRTYSFPKWIE